MPDPPWCDFLPTAQILQKRKPFLASPSMCFCVPLECSEQQPITSLSPAPTLLDWCCYNSSDEPSAVEVTQCVPLECSEQQPITSLLPAPTLLDWCCHNSSDEPSAVEITQCVPLDCSEQQPTTSLLPAPTLLDWCCHNCSEEPFVAKVQFVAVAKPCLVGRECCLGRPHSVSVHRFVCLRSSPLSDWTILKDVTHSADIVLNLVTQLELVLSPTCISHAILLDGFMLSQLFRNTSARCACAGRIVC